MVFADRLRELAADSGLNIKDFCADIGVSYRTVQNYLAEKSTPNGQFLTLINEKTGASPNWLLLGKAPKYVSSEGQEMGGENLTMAQSHDEFVPFHRLSVEASAGHGSLVQDENSVGYYSFKKDWLERRGLKPGNLSVISVSGDSMEPDLYDGDLIVVDQSQTDLRDSNIYAVRFDAGLYVKRIQRAPGGRVMLLSRNQNYSELVVDDSMIDDLDNGSFQIIGRVVASMHEW